jgi:hypothetical protein
MKTSLLLLLFVSFARAQNLIPDSSFENNKAIPVDFSAINSSNSWNMPTQGTTDLFCQCNLRLRVMEAANPWYLMIRKSTNNKTEGLSLCW